MPHLHLDAPLKNGIHLGKELRDDEAKDTIFLKSFTGDMELNSTQKNLKTP